MMKRIFFALPLLAFAGFSAPSNLEAAPLGELRLPPDSQWLVHFDADQWRASRSGAVALEEVAKIEFDEMPETLPLNPLQIFDGVHSVTLFGPSLLSMTDENGPDGVILLTVNEQLMQVVQGAVAAMEIEQPEQFQVIDRDGTLIYGMDGQFFGSYVDAHSIALAKNLATLEAFLAEGGQPASRNDLVMRMSPAWSDGGSFLLLALADGINQMEGLPPQARILQLTQGLAVQVWEDGDWLRLAVALVTDGPETSRQVQQVLQGLIAMAALTQNGDPEVSAIVNSARVSQTEKTVRFEVSYPLERAIYWIRELAQMIEDEANMEVEIEGAAEAQEEALEAEEEALEAGAADDGA